MLLFLGKYQNQNQNHIYWPGKFAQTRNLTPGKVALSVLTQNIHHNTIQHNTTQHHTTTEQDECWCVLLKLRGKVKLCVLPTCVCVCVCVCVWQKTRSEERRVGEE